MKNNFELVLSAKDNLKKSKVIEDITKKKEKIARLTQNLESLKTKIQKIKSSVDTQTKTPKKELAEATEIFVTVLIKKYNLKSFTLWQREILGDLITEEFNNLSNLGEFSDKIKELSIEFSKKLASEMDPDEQRMSKEMMQNEFEAMGLDIDFEDFDLNSMKDPEFIKKLQEKIFENRKEEKQQLKEEKVEHTDVDFQKLYKKLAKMTHPDLCRDESEKEFKNNQMKLLTTAWEERDYYQIILLWMEIDPENTVGLEINEYNQKSIVKQLNKKITDLEREEYMIKNHDPNTSFYYNFFNANSEKGIDNKIKKYIASLEEDKNDMLLKIKDAENTSVLKKMLGLIYENDRASEFDDFLSRMF